jgi:hypothetical protein
MTTKTDNPLRGLLTTKRDVDIARVRTAKAQPTRSVRVTKADGARIVNQVAAEVAARIAKLEATIDERNRRQAAVNEMVVKLLALEERICGVEAARGGTVRTPVGKMVGLTTAEQIRELATRGPRTGRTDAGKVSWGILQ